MCCKMLPSVQAELQPLVKAARNPWMSRRSIAFYARAFNYTRNLRISHQTVSLYVKAFSHTVHQLAGKEEELTELSFTCAEKQRYQDDIGLVVLLKSCALQKDLSTGRHLHADVVKNDLLKTNIFVGNTLLNMYAKCGAVAKARQVFDELPSRTLVSWTALIVGYAEHGLGEHALNSYEQMKNDGLSPDAVTRAGILKACGSIRAAQKGMQIHAEILREGLLGKYVKLGSALVDMYAKCGALARAREVLDELPIQNLVTWTTLIGAFCQQEHGEEALNCYEQMKGKGLSPDAVTFSCILKACGSVGAAMKGQEIHAEVARLQLLDSDPVLASALVDMYAKCGALVKAQEAFDKLCIRDVGSWTALITGYDQVGKHEVVLDSFNKMIGEKIEPTPVTLVVVLNACRYLSLVDEGQLYFDSMREKYGIIPTLEHHTCMVGLFGRVGYLAQSLKEIKKMPCSDFLPPWLTLLTACQKWGNVNLGRIAFENAVRLDKKSAVAYICMNNIYAGAGMQEDADKIEALRIENGAWMVEDHGEL